MARSAVPAVAAPVTAAAPPDAGSAGAAPVAHPLRGGGCAWRRRGSERFPVDDRASDNHAKRVRREFRQAGPDSAQIGTLYGIERGHKERRRPHARSARAAGLTLPSPAKAGTTRIVPKAAPSKSSEMAAAQPASAAVASSSASQ